MYLPFFSSFVQIIKANQYTLVPDDDVYEYIWTCIKHIVIRWRYNTDKRIITYMDTYSTEREWDIGMIDMGILYRCFKFYNELAKY